MITVLASPPAASAKWSDLADELDRWGEQGRIATLWWRDDDAAAPSRRLDDLLATAGAVPVALAVIPAIADQALAARLDGTTASRVRVLQHGWRHRDHAAGGKKSEFPPSRSHAEMTAELTAGRRRLLSLFGARALAVLAPPWNRFEDALLPLLAASGIGGISRIKPRQAAWPAPDVFAANTQVDLVAWRGDRGFVGEAAALGGIVGHLRARRCGEADPDEPTGILTHHLVVQDEATGAFLGRLLGWTRAHAAARWLDAAEVFAPALTAAGTAGHA
jgi:hypothetical protein